MAKRASILSADTAQSICTIKQERLASAKPVLEEPACQIKRFQAGGGGVIAQGVGSSNKVGVAGVTLGGGCLCLRVPPFFYHNSVLFFILFDIPPANEGTMGFDMLSFGST